MTETQPLSAKLQQNIDDELREKVQNKVAFTKLEGIASNIVSNERAVLDECRARTINILRSRLLYYANEASSEDIDTLEVIAIYETLEKILDNNAKALNALQYFKNI